MTTEEFLNNSNKRHNLKMLFGSFFKESEIEVEVKQLITDFAKLKCEKQKQLCLDEIKSCLKYDVDWTLQVYENKILETKLPEF